MCEDQLHPYCTQLLHETLSAFLEQQNRHRNITYPPKKKKKSSCCLDAEQHIETKGQVSKRAS